ncbi:hypothetical protein [Palleronia pelagia]|uniref:Uncharacterized protein n=1 Tax=Palleronia pelagia TaxID=387096 RepID=A0A1H8AQ18_9RHOB|nr:hypothetical protein [Palleronia pelagia]SEM72811.1 hypothetical protein SAMN04488011_101259 [Palleronia pelagia]
MPEFEDWDAYDAWLQGQPREVVVAMAARSALRSAPALLAGDGPTDVGLVLLGFRAMLISGVAAVGPTAEIREAAYSAARSAAFSATDSADFAFSAARSAAFSATDAVRYGPNFAYFAARSTDAARFAARSADSAAHSGRSGVSAARSAVSDDSLYASDAISVLARPLWPRDLRFDGIAPDLIDRAAEANPVWSFWARWHDGFLKGAPLDWELQTQIALIPDEAWHKAEGETWQQVAERIAGKIAGIEARFDVRQKKEALEEELRHASIDRLGIGGNLPPEPLDDAPQIDKKYEMIWAPLQVLGEELEKAKPERSRVEAVLSGLTDVLRACLQYAGRKADLAIDVSIKAGVPGSVGYAVLEPEKVSALIEAIRNWLPLI